MQKIKQILQWFLKKSSSGIHISLKEKIQLLDQLSNLLSSGIPITNALKIISYQTRKQKIKALLLDLLEDLNKGISFKESCSKYTSIFSVFDLSIIEMWEVTGKIADSIETIKNKEEKNREIKGKIIWALIYPAVILTLSVWMIMVFMIYVIPKIQTMYKDAKVNLPDLTQNIINISNFLQENLFSLWISIVAFFMIIGFLRKHPRTKIHFDHFVLRIPLFWKLIQKKILSLFTSSLAILLESWVIINKSLEISSHALENDYYEKRLKYINAEVSKGRELSQLMGIDKIQSGKEDFLFPIELASVVKIGEETGRLAPLLGKIWKKYNKEIDDIVKNMQTAIEPIVIIGVWLIIGTIIMAIMLPFFNMVNVI